VPLTTLVLSPAFATIPRCSLDTKLLAVIVNVQTSRKYLPAMYLFGSFGQKDMTLILSKTFEQLTINYYYYYDYYYYHYIEWC